MRNMGGKMYGYIRRQDNEGTGHLPSNITESLAH